MKTKTWLILILIGFFISPGAGGLISALYVFNYSTAIIFSLWAKYQVRGYK